MMKFNKNRRQLVQALGALVLSLGNATKAIAKPQDLLDRPADMHLRAKDSVFLAVARAGTRLVAVGEQGRIILSDDNGNQWQQAKAPTSVTLTAVHFPSAKKGWAVGHSGVVLHTSDGGKTWQKQLDGKLAATLHSASVARQALAGEDAVRQQRIAEQLIADGADKPFLDVYFLNENLGWIVGAYGLAFMTRDGGTAWESIMGRIANPKARHLYAIRPVGNTLYIAGEQGMLLAAADEGARFKVVSSPYKGSYFGVLGSETEILLFGLRGNAYWSGNRGQEWKKIDVGQAVTLTAGCQLGNGDLLLADESGRMLRSRDRGQHFVAVPIEKPSYISGLVEAADGSLILAGARGMIRLAASAIPKSEK